MNQTKCSCGKELKRLGHAALVEHIHGVSHLAGEHKTLQIKHPNDAWQWICLDKAETVQFEKLYGNVRVFKINGNWLPVVDNLTYFSGTAHKYDPWSAICDRAKTSAASSVILPQEIRYQCTLELTETNAMRTIFEENAKEIVSIKPEHRTARLEALGHLEDFHNEALRANRLGLVKSNSVWPAVFKHVGEPSKWRFDYSDSEERRDIIGFLGEYRKIYSPAITAHVIAVFVALEWGLCPFARGDWSMFEPWFERVLNGVIAGGWLEFDRLEENSYTVQSRHMQTNNTSGFSWYCLPIKSKWFTISRKATERSGPTRQGRHVANWVRFENCCAAINNSELLHFEEWHRGKCLAHKLGAKE